ncbi:MAG: type II toxin-antitoxin system VapC family toxin [Thermodesulfobacteria bacterium]|nr:type II toxin-antitoxin system VapC family toxin [Thermodesulfobacteriota bacterium]
MENRNILIDTNIIIEFLRKKNKQKSYLWKIKEMDLNCFISTITVFELYAGAITERHKRDLETAKRSAEIYKELKNNNQLIEFRDIFIGATALEINLPIITLNEEHFKRIKGIKIYDIDKISSST